MIHQNLIKRRADEDGLSAPTVERDYVLTHALAAISEHDRQARVVFKGGTALRLCHFEEYRHSADLDFSLIGGLDVESALHLVADERTLRRAVAQGTIHCRRQGPRRINRVIDEGRVLVDRDGIGMTSSAAAVPSPLERNVPMTGR